MKKRSELDEICCKTHIQPDPNTAADKTNALMDSGNYPLSPCMIFGEVRNSEIFGHYAGLVDPSEVLANIESQICKVKDEALSRREIMDKIDRWLAACDEENWLEDYSKVS